MNRLFQYESMEELNQFSFFDIISPSDLSIFWRYSIIAGSFIHSEYSQLVNSHHQVSRSFVCVVKNPNKEVR